MGSILKSGWRTGTGAWSLPTDPSLCHAERRGGSLSYNHGPEAVRCLGVAIRARVQRGSKGPSLDSPAWEVGRIGTGPGSIGGPRPRDLAESRKAALRRRPPRWGLKTLEPRLQAQDQTALQLGTEQGMKKAHAPSADWLSWWRFCLLCGKEIPGDEDPLRGLALERRGSGPPSPWLAWSPPPRVCGSCGGLAAPPGGSERLSSLARASPEASARVGRALLDCPPDCPVLGPLQAPGALLQALLGSAASLKVTSAQLHHREISSSFRRWGSRDSKTHPRAPRGVSGTLRPVLSRLFPPRNPILCPREPRCDLRHGLSPFLHALSSRFLEAREVTWSILLGRGWQGCSMNKSMCGVGLFLATAEGR